MLYFLLYYSCNIKLDYVNGIFPKYSICISVVNCDEMHPVYCTRKLISEPKLSCQKESKMGYFLDISNIFIASQRTCDCSVSARRHFIRMCLIVNEFEHVRGTEGDRALYRRGQGLGPELCTERDSERRCCTETSFPWAETESETHTTENNTFATPLAGGSKTKNDSTYTSFLLSTFISAQRLQLHLVS